MLQFLSLPAHQVASQYTGLSHVVCISCNECTCIPKCYVSKAGCRSATSCNSHGISRWLHASWRCLSQVVACLALLGSLGVVVAELAPLINLVLVLELSHLTVLSSLAVAVADCSPSAMFAMCLRILPVTHLASAKHFEHMYRAWGKKKPV